MTPCEILFWPGMSCFDFRPLYTWEILTSHNIIRLPNYIKGVFTFAIISYPVDETFSNLT